ncbi:hypothetical protein GDO86_019096 [Hymenochirus boettgeri]|uniref:INO80 complex subunit E N-terminal domain-containing protein n=1 Tax=Hymenochirus boettgeri TaxID=247094 RepID=A0A8T2IHZ7_9PIPI|nr:hypothetical protein GDO86_019096 [Hymenochirus boettgeri]
MPVTFLVIRLCCRYRFRWIFILPEQNRLTPAPSNLRRVPTVPNGMNGQADGEVDYKRKYKNLKRKLKFLIYEQECFQEELRRAQRKLLKVSQDKSFLLDRILQYENVDDDSSDSDLTASSENSDTEGAHGLSTPPVKR